LEEAILPGIDFSGFGDSSAVFPLILGQMLLSPWGDTDRADKRMSPTWQLQENSIAEKNRGFPRSILGLSETFYLLILLRGLSLLSRIACSFCPNTEFIEILDGRTKWNVS